MSYRNRQSIGGVGGFRDLFQPQDARHHRLHLCFGGIAVTGNRGLHFRRGVYRYGQTLPGGLAQGDTHGLHRGGDRLEVFFGEDPLYRDNVRFETKQV